MLGTADALMRLNHKQSIAPGFYVRAKSSKGFIYYYRLLGVSMNEFRVQSGRRGDVVETRYEDEDGVVFVADFGVSEGVTVDIVDDTAIAVAGEEQHEVELPDGDATARANNGVVTVEVRR